MQRLAAVLSFPILLVGQIACAQMNVVVILADDLGAGDLKCYGHHCHKTPNIDALANSGVRFSQAYAAAPVCSPTRASIITGKYPARLKLTTWFRNDGSRADDIEHVDALPSSELTIAAALRALGYATANIGKWHLGPHSPTRYGFDINIAGHSSGMAVKGYHLPNDILPDEEGYLTDKLTDHAIDFVKKNAARPFFLFLSYYTPHIPLDGRKDLIAGYPKLPKDQANYAAMVECLDENVGRLLLKLQELKLMDNTLIIFTSDNGGFTAVTNNLPFRAGKGYMFEGGLRVPLIIRLPGSPPTTQDEPVISTDLYPTVLAAIGAAAQPRQHVDGISLLPLLTSDGKLFDRGALFWHFPHYANRLAYPQSEPAGAVRRGDWKLIEYYTSRTVALYNIKDDPGEKNDLAGLESERTNKMRADLAAWRAEVGAAMRLEPEPELKLEMQHVSWFACLIALICILIISWRKKWLIGREPKQTA